MNLEGWPFTEARLGPIPRVVLLQLCVNRVSGEMIRDWMVITHGNSLRERDRNEGQCVFMPRRHRH